MRNQKAALASAIEELIEEYRNDGSVLWTDEVAQQLRLEHPRCGAGVEQIATMMAAEAMEVGVPILLPCGRAGQAGLRDE